MNEHLARYEQIRVWELVPAEFTLEGGELTPTLKGEAPGDQHQVQGDPRPTLRRGRRRRRRLSDAGLPPRGRRRPPGDADLRPSGQAGQHLHPRGARGARPAAGRAPAPGRHRLPRSAVGEAGMFIAGADVAEIAGVSDPAQAESRIALRPAALLGLGGSALPHRLGGLRDLPRRAARSSPWPRPTSSSPTVRTCGSGCRRSSSGSSLAGEAACACRAGSGWSRRSTSSSPARRSPGRQALRMGLADALFPEAGFLHHVRDFAARRRSAASDPRRKPAGRPEAPAARGARRGRWFVLDQARKKTLAASRGRYPAPLAALEVVRIGLEKGTAAGFDAEARAVRELAISPTAKNLIHLFGLMEAAKKDGPADAAAVAGGPPPGGSRRRGDGRRDRPAHRRQGRSAGAGQGHPGRGALHRPEACRGALREAGPRRRLQPAEMRRRMALLQPTLEDGGLAGSDFVLEAVVENLAVKQRLFADLSRRLAPTAILATNTSSLSIDAIGQLATRRERVVGMHFFNPVDRMPLVEVIAGSLDGRDRRAHRDGASPGASGKTPVVVRDGAGLSGQPPARLLFRRSDVAARRGPPGGGDRPRPGRLGDADGAAAARRRGRARRLGEGRARSSTQPFPTDCSSPPGSTGSPKTRAGSARRAARGSTATRRGASRSRSGDLRRSRSRAGRPSSRRRLPSA